MKLTRSFVSLALVFSLSLTIFLSFPVKPTFAQDSKIALQRGYRTGYSDGYMAGYRDSIENAKRSYARHDEYTKADRAYSKDYGIAEDYRDGYQQGFEFGYDTGFEKRSFDAALPIELKKRGIAATNSTTETQTATVEANVPANEVNNQPQQQTAVTTAENVVLAQNDGQTIVIPADTELIVELVGDINTEQNRAGDKFQARVVSPTEISGALIDGRVAKIQKPGRIKRRAELSLSFDRINFSENRWSNYNAILTEVLAVKGDNVKRVDNEGTVEGKRDVKNDVAKVGASTGAGMVVGGLIGGPVGVGVGAGVGAAFGAGAVVVERGKHVKLIKGQQLRIKTAYETQIR